MAESYPNGYKTLWEKKIARYEQFLLFPQCFQKACFPGASKGVIVWDWVLINLRRIHSSMQVSELSVIQPLIIKQQGVQSKIRLHVCVG